MAFQKGHGRKNFVVIKTDDGYYAAGVAGQYHFADHPLKGRLFENEGDAREFYERGLKRTCFKKALPREYTLQTIKLAEGRDQNR